LKIDCGYSSDVEHFPSIPEALGSIPRTEKKKKFEINLK
jgi:hypothetical protein